MLCQQVANIADLYFKTSLKARLSIVYVETWEDQDQVDHDDDENDENLLIRMIRMIRMIRE